MAWFCLFLFVYLLMVFVTRVVYEAGLDEKTIPTYSWGERKDEARWTAPIFWPVGLPLILGAFVGKVLRKGLEIARSNPEDMR